MSLLTEVMDLLDTVGERTCLYELANRGVCPDLFPNESEESYCEPCRARLLLDRLTRSWQRVVDQQNAIKP